MNRTIRLSTFVLLISLVATSLGSTAANGASVTLKSAPSIGVVAKAGSFLTAKLAAFNVKPSKASYQWFLNDKPIAKATSASFKIPTTMRSGKLQLLETAFFGKVKKVVASNVINIGKLLITRTASLAYADGSNAVLKVNFPLIQPTPTRIDVTWLRNGFPIASDGASTRSISATDRGARISVRLDVQAPSGYSSLTITTAEQPIAAAQRIYVQGWSEEFSGANGDTASSSDWVGEDGDGTDFGNRGWGNNELQWYNFQNATTDGNGSLNILAKRTNATSKTCYYGPCQWYSAKLVTKGKVGFKYGRLEARIKAAGGAGTWNAFWTLGADIDTKFWPMCGEIDVTELVGSRPRDVLGYSHGPISGGPGRGATTVAATNWASDYHVYAIDWLPDQITWYLDGVKYATVDKTDADWVFDHEFYVILNLAMGGTLGGTADPALSQATMSVDYVRWSTIDGVGTLYRH